eukprot:1033966-Amphidinium_carterae.2
MCIRDRHENTSPKKDPMFNDAIAKKDPMFNDAIAKNKPMFNDAMTCNNQSSTLSLSWSSFARS